MTISQTNRIRATKIIFAVAVCGFLVFFFQSAHADTTVEIQNLDPQGFIDIPEPPPLPPVPSEIQLLEAPAPFNTSFDPTSPSGIPDTLSGLNSPLAPPPEAGSIFEVDTFSQFGGGASGAASGALGTVDTGSVSSAISGAGSAAGASEFIGGISPADLDPFGGATGLGALGGGGGLAVHDSAANAKLAGLLKTTGTTAANTGATAAGVGALVNKELSLDGILRALTTTALRAITQSIVSWINSGFEGSPAFVTDLEEHLTDITDQIAGDIIYGSELGFLCNAFELDVRVAIALQDQTDYVYRSACRLSDVAGNVEDFFAGDFSQGGWSRWFEVVAQPQNNPYGSALIAHAELEERQAAALDRERQRLNWGDGFLSVDVCEDTNTNIFGEEGRISESAPARRACRTVTPGSLIREHMSFELKIGETLLLEADEINESISAIFSALAQQIITGTGGLLGASSGGSGSGSNFTASVPSSSYLGALGDPTRNQVADPLGTGRASFVDATVRRERAYIDAQRNVIGAVEDLESALQDAATQCPGAGGSLSSSERSARSSAEQEIASAEALIDILAEIDERFRNASTAQEESAIYNEYLALLSQLPFHNTSQSAQVELEAGQRAGEISRKTNELELEVEECLEDDRNGGAGQDQGGDGGE